MGVGVGVGDGDGAGAGALATTTVMVFPCSTAALTGSLWSVTFPGSTWEFSTSTTKGHQTDSLEGSLGFFAGEAPQFRDRYLARGNHQFDAGAHAHALPRRGVRW